jgi:hypothetical protein
MEIENVNQIRMYRLIICRETENSQAEMATEDWEFTQPDNMHLSVFGLVCGWFVFYRL